MTMEDIMLLQAIFSTIVCLLEFPGGYIGDRIGYKTSLMVGLCINLVGWTTYSLATSFWEVALAQTILATGLTFITGCDQAMIYESLKSANKVQEYPLWNKRYIITGQTAESLAALTAGILYAHWAQLPLIIEVGIYFIGIGLAVFLHEPSKDSKRQHISLNDMRHVVVDSLGTNQALKWILLISALFSLATYYPVWIVQLYADAKGVPSKWLGFIWAFANFMVIVGAGISHRVQSKVGLRNTLYLCIGLLLMGYGGLGMSEGAFGVGFYFIITLLRGINFTLLTEKIQELANSESRASVLSLRSFLVRGCFAISAPAIGWWMDQKGFNPVLITLGILFAGGLALLLKMSNKKQA